MIDDPAPERLGWLRYLISDTPRFIRITVILVLLGLIVLAVVVIAAAVWDGRREIRAWGLQFNEYHPPEVQKCIAAVTAIPGIEPLNKDALDSYRSQIQELNSLRDKYTLEAARINNTSGLSGYSADRLREESEKIRKEVLDLQAKQDEIANSRKSIIDTIRNACGVGH
jgi:hypothetical protein